MINKLAQKAWKSLKKKHTYKQNIFRIRRFKTNECSQVVYSSAFSCRFQKKKKKKEKRGLKATYFVLLGYWRMKKKKERERFHSLEVLGIRE